LEQGRTSEITELLRAWAGGDQSAVEDLVPLIERPLQRLARRHLAGKFRGATLDTAALVNETYLRLIAAKQLTWKNRSHFFALSARVMRGILVDHARRRGSTKRGSNYCFVSLDENVRDTHHRTVDLVRLDDALSELSKVDRRKVQVVELRFFGGFTEEETAELLSVSIETIKRDWRLAKMWLLRELSRR
jgi:RNA polymerase sigma factor (TIGR02999 family)